LNLDTPSFPTRRSSDLEKTGVAAARADLFVNAACVVTPTRKSNAAALRQVERFWKSLGGRVLRLRPEVHDALVSRSSHLPHVARSEEHTSELQSLRHLV